MLNTKAYETEAKIKAHNLNSLSDVYMFQRRGWFVNQMSVLGAYGRLSSDLRISCLHLGYELTDWQNVFR